MALFTKKETVYQVRGDRAQWKTAKAALQEWGISGIRSGSYEDTAPRGGCGAKLDVRDFGPKGRIDRALYYLDVPVDHAGRARAILTVAGLPTYNG